jgi:hypothetical protein
VPEFAEDALLGVCEPEVGAGEGEVEDVFVPYPA